MLESLFPLNIKDVDEARKIYRSCSGSNPARAAVALQKWNEFYLPVIRKAIADKDVEAFFGAIASIKMPGEGEAKKEAEAALDLFLPLISTPQLARKLYRMFPFNCFGSSREHPADKIKERWDELSSPEIERAEGIAEIKSAVENSFYNGELFIKGMLKWTDACCTVEEIDALSKFSGSVGSCRKSINYLIPEAIKQKKMSILFAETPKVNDIETIKFYYSISPEGSAVQIFVYERWLNLCSTPLQASEAFSRAPQGRVVCQVGAYKRVKEILSAA